MEMRRMRFASLVIALFFCADGAGAASYSETIRLVRSMREDEILMLGMHVALAENAGKTVRYPKEDLPCIALMKYPLITDAIALVISSQLTNEEVAEGLAFYRSDVGRKLTEQTYRGIRDDLVVDYSYLTAAEQRALAAFMKRPVGRKFFEQKITQQDAVLRKIDERIKVGIEDCRGRQQSDAVQFPVAQCASLPVMSPDGTCWAEIGSHEYSKASGLAASTNVTVGCGRDSTVVASYRGRPKLALEWLGPGSLEIARPAALQPEFSARAPATKVAYRNADAAIDAPKCWPLKDEMPGIDVEMDSIASQPFWMYYGDEQRCLLSKRIGRQEAPGLRRDVVIQFKKLKQAEHPLGTADLFLFEDLSTEMPARSVRLTGAGLASVEMNPGLRRIGSYVSGVPADGVLRHLAAGKAVQLNVQPINGAPFEVAVNPTDFDWAYPPFAECLKRM